MRVITAGIILTTSCLFVTLSGCQLGKSPFGSLAWWQNKDDELASRYIEPPSHQFTPSESAVVSDDPNLPPLPPDIEKTVDSFEQEVARSYRELARETGKASDQLVSTSNDIKQDTKEMLMPAEREPVSSSEFSNPLTPRSERYALNNTASGGNNALMPKASANPEASGFQPGGMTEYEKLASKTLQPSEPGTFVPTRPEARLPNAQLPVKPAANNNDFAFAPKAPVNKIETTAPTQPSLSKAQPNTEAQQVNFEYPSTPYEAFQPRSSGDTGSPALPDPAKLTEKLVNSMSQSANNFVESTANAVENAVPDMAAKAKAPAGLSLQLQGQGSYAPGSIRAPNPIDPSQLVLPTNGSTSK